MKIAKRKASANDKNAKNQSRGFGFVELYSKDEAKKVLEKLNGTLLHEHVLSLEISRNASDSETSNQEESR